MQTDSAKRTSRAALGRPRVTSRAALERLAFELFARRGFDETTVDDIAAAAGIGRRTFFRYFASKTDLVWGDFEGQLERLRTLLDDADPGAPMMEAVREAVVAFNRYDPQEVPWHRQRMELILRVPTLQADATLRYAAWREIVAAFVAARTGQPPTAMLPLLAGYAVLAASISAYEYWLSVDAAEDLTALLDASLRRIAEGIAAADPASEGGPTR
ncbi:mycofactocin system transcriptional regulator [Actinocorallia aurea]